MGDIPSKQLLCDLPQEAGKESCLKSGAKRYPSIRNDFVNQKAHPQCNKERDKIFQGKSGHYPQIEKRAEMGTLENVNGGGKNHAQKEENPCKNNHKKVDRFSSKGTPILFDSERPIKDRPQGTEYPRGSPD
jgi:hypothetical protein